MTRNVLQIWQQHTKARPDADAIIHWVAGEEPYRWKYKQLFEKAEYYAQQLYYYGIRQGEVCALIIRHHHDFYPLYFSVCLLGAIPAVLAYPNPRLHPEKFREGIIGMSQRSGLDHILTQKELLDVLSPLINPQKTTIKAIHLPLDEKKHNAEKTDFIIRTDAKPEDPFLLQHSSGTTGLQKPVLISNHALLFHAESYGEALRIKPDDKVVSWLPLYHDMGLIASFHLPLIWGIPSIQINTFDWVLAPELMIEAISKEKATLAWMPNFAFHLMANKIHDEDIQGYSLESIRMLINSSEPIRKNSHERFIRKFKKFGFNPDAISTLYGMAETTMAVTQTPAGQKPVEFQADREALAQGYLKISENEANARVCISAGKVIKGCEIQIWDENKNPLPEGKVGEIVIKSVSMFDGYRNYPEKTAEVMYNGWYLSGDIGFEYQNEYFIIGRKKDIIIHTGKNIFPEDIEDAVNQVNGVIPGRVIAFGQEDEESGTELIGIIAETYASTPEEKKTIAMDIVKAAMDIDVTITYVYLVPPRWLIKSSAGKPGRKINKERILQPDAIKQWKVL